MKKLGRKRKNEAGMKMWTKANRVERQMDNGEDKQKMEKW